MDIYSECLKMGVDPDTIELEKKENIDGYTELADEINKEYVKKLMEYDEFENSAPMEPPSSPKDLLWQKHFQKKYEKFFNKAY